FRDTAPTHLYSPSLHDALPISRISSDELVVRNDPTLSARVKRGLVGRGARCAPSAAEERDGPSFSFERRPALVTHPAPGMTKARDRKSTRLNSSHVKISYAVFC